MAVKIIEFHNQQYFVGEYYFAEIFDSIITVSHDGNAVLKATPDVSIILGSVDVTPNELENRELLSRRLSTLPPSLSLKQVTLEPMIKQNQLL